MPLSASPVAQQLGLGPEYDTWLDALERLGPPTDGLRLPEGPAAIELFQKLEVDDVDVEALLAARPSPAATPEVWWLLERAYHDVQRRVGDLHAVSTTPQLPSSLGATGRCFWIFVYLAA